MKRVGIDLGGTFIKCGVVDEKHRILSQAASPTMVKRTPDAVIEDMAFLVKKVADKAQIPIEELAGIGIGSPGIIDAESGEVVYSNNFGWEHVPLGSRLGNMLGLPVRVSNDANCAALGELVCDSSSVYKNAVLLTLGTGVGSGIIIDGKLYEGGAPGGAELGHMVVCHGGRKCSCGRNGCLETYVSASALINDAKTAASSHTDSVLHRLCEMHLGAGQQEDVLEALDGKDVIEAVRQGDSAAKEVFDRYLENLACGIVNIINIFRPEAVYLGGGICEGFDLMDRYLNEYVRKNCFGGTMTKPTIIKKASHGNAAGIIGAAALCLNFRD